MNAKQKTREQWLGQVARAAVPLFKKAGYDLKLTKVRISVGWPGVGGARAKARIGECWADTCSSDGNHEIFISPRVDDSFTAAHITIHELVHVMVGVKAKHRSAFRKCALAVGLTGKMAATTAGKELAKWIKKLIKRIGKYPHGAMSGLDHKKQSTRLVKVQCMECGYIARVTMKWIEMLGAPLCPCNTEAMEVM